MALRFSRARPSPTAGVIDCSRCVGFHLPEPEQPATVTAPADSHQVLTSLTLLLSQLLEPGSRNR